MVPLDLAALRGRLPSCPTTRFAPSPTGFLHLGYVVNAIYVWGIARASGAGCCSGSKTTTGAARAGSTRAPCWRTWSGSVSLLQPGEERFSDARLGQVSQAPSEQCGDLLLRDRIGNWTYQFAVVVDDLRQGVDLVIRGEDLLLSTGRQILLGRLLGRERPPVFLHHPLIRRADGSKLGQLFEPRDE